jgi:multiple sugar transport system ATP-binding protein
VFRERHQFNPGQQIHLAPNLSSVHLFDKGSGQRV